MVGVIVSIILIIAGIVAFFVAKSAFSNKDENWINPEFTGWVAIEIGRAHV